MACHDVVFGVFASSLFCSMIAEHDTLHSRAFVTPSECYRDKAAHFRAIGLPCRMMTQNPLARSSGRRYGAV